MKQQITNIILEMIGENYFVAPDGINDYDFGYNQALQDLRDKAPDIADRIANKILNEITDIYIDADQREDRVELSDIEKLLQ